MSPPPAAAAAPVATFVAVFAAVTAIGFLAAFWRRPAGEAHLDEWGLGGRRFGAWITWFLVGGDFYTAYTVIAVPALVYATGAYGFFALPYTVLVYPIVLVAMPPLWREARESGAVSAADIVRARTGSRALELAVALTGLVATMPYIALQLVGMRAALRGLGLSGELPLAVAFLILAAYTYVAGLRAPALVAIAKDAMITVVVVVAVAMIPEALGGWGHVFAAADARFRAEGHGGVLLARGQALPYATLALGSALAAFLYPHTLTGVLAARGEDTLRRNAIWLPFYTLLLGLVALLGLMAIAAGLHPASPTDAVTALFARLFSGWFEGFALAAIAVAALVPAAVMSIGAANLFTRNLWKAWIDPRLAGSAEARLAKNASLAVKVAALGFVLLLPTEFAIDLQLLGTLWILQTLPAVLLGRALPLTAPGLLAGWAAGQALGTILVIEDGLRPVHLVHAAGGTYGIYVGLIALAANLAVAGAVSALTRPRDTPGGSRAPRTARSAS